MYYSNINDVELQEFHDTVHVDRVVPKSKILSHTNYNQNTSICADSELFKNETIISDELYRSCPLIYADELLSTDADKILENKVVLWTPSDNGQIVFSSDNLEGLNDIIFTFRRVTPPQQSAYQILALYFYEKMTKGTNNHLSIRYSFEDLSDDGDGIIFVEPMTEDYGYGEFSDGYCSFEDVNITNSISFPLKSDKHFVLQVPVDAVVTVEVKYKNNCNVLKLC